MSASTPAPTPAQPAAVTTPTTTTTPIPTPTRHDDPRTTTHMDAPTTPAVELVDVVKSFGSGSTEVRALRGVSLAIAPGELVAVMGPSGCGKSTLLHLAGGLEQPSAGRVLLHGRDLGDLDATGRAALRRSEVSFVFQRLNLLASLTALENVSLPLELDGVGAREARDRAHEALIAVGLDSASVGRLDRYPDEFSGGQQQRIAIARAIVGRQRVLLCDEPTGALDVATADSVIELLAGLPQRFGTTVVLVTHEPRFASWADRVVFLRDGEVVDQTPSLLGVPVAAAAPMAADEGSTADTADTADTAVADASTPEGGS
jgi:putative ABC transport system ATP-binding protein